MAALPKLAMRKVFTKCDKFGIPNSLEHFHCAFIHCRAAALQYAFKRDF